MGDDAPSALVSPNSHQRRRSWYCRFLSTPTWQKISNHVDLRQYAERETRYMNIIRRYDPAEVARFPQMLALVTMALEAGFHDCLGQLFMALELGDHWKGQFFTPYEVSYLMANLTTGDVVEKVKQQGFVSVNEPAAGAGAMVVLLGNSLTVEEREVWYTPAHILDGWACRLARKNQLLVQAEALAVSAPPPIVIEERALPKPIPPVAQLDLFA